MCGFVGTFGGENNPRDGLLFEIGAAAKHRGPDDTGFWTDDNYKILFNRLAIIELTDAGRQPMCIRNWVIAFNGEIYNHLEIRKRLPEFNYRGSSDTETLCLAIETWGFERALTELNGMFAVAAYNKAEKTLSLARDYAGIKPLFYSVGTGNIWFASQFNQVVEGIGKGKVTLCQSGMRDFLQLGYMQAPNTVYKEIQQVLPGEIVSFDINKRFKRVRYYELPRGFNNRQASSNGHQKFGQLMTNTVDDQLVSDVPIGCFISSGIDSALVSGYASRSNKKVKTFTIGVKGDVRDERPKAGQYARAIGVDHYTDAISSHEIWGAVEDSIRLSGEPFGDYSSVPTYLITKSARKHNTVMLSGDGGDELFWGYPRWNTYLTNYNRFRLPKYVRRAQRYLSRNQDGRYANGPGVIETPGEWVLNGQSHNNAVTMSEIMPGSQNTSGIRRLYKFEYGPNQLEFRNWLRWNEFYGHLQRVLTKVDRMSMANSLEVRVPFLDRRIVEFAWNQESLYGQSHFINKDFLKKQLEHFVPPDQINHDKIGFDVPMDQWLKGPLKSAVQDALIGSRFYGSENINEMALSNYVADYYAGKTLNAWGIWILYAWQKWGEYMRSAE
jgi:asparagine synthase (glutamine-hydrolysing)